MSLYSIFLSMFRSTSVYSIGNLKANTHKLKVKTMYKSNNIERYVWFFFLLFSFVYITCVSTILMARMCKTKFAFMLRTWRASASEAWRLNQPFEKPHFCSLLSFSIVWNVCRCFIVSMSCWRIAFVLLFLWPGFFLCISFLSRSGAVNTTNYKYVTCLKYTAFYWSRSFNVGKGQDLYLCPFNTHVKYCLQANWQRPSIVDFQIAAAVIVIKMFRDYNCHLKKLPVLSLCGWWRKRAIWVRMDQTHHKHSRCRVQIQMKRTPMCKSRLKIEVIVRNPWTLLKKPLPWRKSWGEKENSAYR